ncbi:TIGR02234 family membrane protein [Nocardia bovistercoris]|uniref:TIGR02234 family membrane protein n=1 Tax=Nocardia bovistercoris TaxID=2785916 RepID=A0A931N5X5_9NOCA|nr:TIGR02234 family membrane protein [Nocardia bovistercoris]MBH0780172.1 TIGR02234 family membrane protein [Nocardia bovistercoris]
MTASEPERTPVPEPTSASEREFAPASESDTASAAEPRNRRYPVGAIVLLGLAAAAMWGASRLTWVTVTSTDGLTQPRTDELAGGVWFGALTPLALVLVAAVAAVLATRGWLRRLIGVLIGLVAAVTAVPAFALVTGSGATEERAATLAELPGRATVTEVVAAPFPAWLTLFAAAAVFVAAVALARMPEQTARLSGKYENPAFRRAAATEQVSRRKSDAETGDGLSERVLWDALDAGADPTEDTAPAAPDERASETSRRGRNAS